MYKKKGSPNYYMTIKTPDGKEKQISLGTPSPRLAKKLEAKVKVEIAEGKFFKKKTAEYLTVSKLLEIYLEKHSKPNKKEKTWKNECFFAKKVNQKLGEIFVHNLTPARIEEYMVQRRKDGVSDITVHHELKLLKHAYKLALERWDLIDASPFDKVQLPKGDRKRIRYLSPEEETALMDNIPDWLRPMVVIAKETGLRLSNICDLTWDQVDLFQKSISVEKTKTDHPVWLPLTANVTEELLKRNKVRSLHKKHVFMKNGKRLNRWQVSRAFRRACKRAEVENFRFHDLRHHFCSFLVQQGVPLEVVKDLAGHRDLATTTRYAHLAPENKRRAMSVFDENRGNLVEMRKKK